MDDPDSFLPALARFTSSDRFYQHSSKIFEYTEGVKFLADHAGAYWLLDTIAAWQKKARKDPDLRTRQIWILTVENNRGFLNCYHAPGDLRFFVRIPFTDFPLESITLNLSGGVLMLPSEC